MLPTKDQHYQVGQWACFRSRIDASIAVGIPVRTLDVRIYRGKYGEHSSQHKYRKTYEKKVKKEIVDIGGDSIVINNLWNPVKSKSRERA